MGRYFAAIDLGGDSISSVTARWLANGNFTIEGFCRERSKGFKNGIVSDVALATDSIRLVMDKLKAKCGKRVDDIYTGVRSAMVDILPSYGTLLLSRYGREISESDVTKCVDIGSTVKVQLDKEPLHKIIRGFSVDGENGIKNPLKMEGVKLGVEVNIVTVNSSTIRNISRCISQAGFVPAGFVLSGLAASYRILSDEEKRGGVVLMDISEEMTHVMIFHDGMLAGYRGVSHAVPLFDPVSYTVDTEKVVGLAEDIVTTPGWPMVKKVKVCGKGALVNDLLEKMEKQLGLSVTAGNCMIRPKEELPPERTGYYVSLGILDYLQAERIKNDVGRRFGKKVVGSIASFIDRYF